MQHVSYSYYETLLTAIIDITRLLLLLWDSAYCYHRYNALVSVITCYCYHNASVTNMLHEKVSY